MGDEQANQQASEARAAQLAAHLRDALVTERRLREAAQRNAEEWKAAWYEIGKIARHHGCPDLAVTTVHRWLDARLRALEQAERERDALREALQDLYDDWNGPRTPLLARAKAALGGSMQRAEASSIQPLLRTIDRATRNNCPVCGSGVNKWGHTASCALYLALEPLPTLGGAPDAGEGESHDT